MSRRKPSMVGSSRRSSLRAELNTTLGAGVHPGVRNEILELKSIVNTLSKEERSRSEQELEAFNAFESLKVQVEALRVAFDTMSEVLVEEADSIRKQNSTRSGALEQQLSICSKAMHGIRTGVAKAQTEADTFRAQVRGMLDTHTAQLTALNAEVEHLRRDASLAVALKNDVDVVNTRFRAHVTEFEQLKTLSTHASERLQELSIGHVALRDKTAAMREDYGTATSALAQDVASLAGECARLRDSHRHLEDGAALQREQFEQHLELQRAKDIKIWSEQLESLGREVRLLQERGRKAEQEHTAHAGRLRSYAEESMANSADEVRLAMQQMRSSESKLRAQQEELSARLKDQSSVMERQHAALHHAISAIADVLHISVPVFRI